LPITSSAAATIKRWNFWNSSSGFCVGRRTFGSSDART
jgi:hypothetical protein